MRHKRIATDVTCACFSATCLLRAAGHHVATDGRGGPFCTAALASRSARPHRPTTCRSASASVMFFTASISKLGSSSHASTMFTHGEALELAGLATARQ